eukprot:11581576-Alexandrium_andersonii.AAC.1
MAGGASTRLSSSSSTPTHTAGGTLRCVASASPSRASSMGTAIATGSTTRACDPAGSTLSVGSTTAG